MKKQKNVEIDLLEIYLIIQKNFLTIILITIVPTILSIIYFFNQNPNQTKFRVEAQIEPISIFSVSEYIAYNNYLKNYMYRNIPKIINEENKNLMITDIIKIDNEQLIINEKTLINLFIDKIKERTIFLEGIKKFNLVDKQNFESQIDYENAAKSLANNIKINKSSQENGSHKWSVQFQTSNINKLDLFLFFIEEKTNEEVRKYLNEIFENLIQNEERLNKYNIEDLDIQILNSKDNLELQKNLIKIRELMVQNKHTQRLKNLFQSTPVLNSTNFFAAKILTHSTKVTNVTEKNKSGKIVLIITFISFVMGLFFVIIKDSIKYRKTS